MSLVSEGAVFRDALNDAQPSIAGAGVRIEGAGSVILRHLWVEGNTASLGPGGLDVEGGLGTLSNSVVFANTGTPGNNAYAFAAIIAGTPSTLVLNNVFAGNLDSTYLAHWNPAGEGVWRQRSADLFKEEGDGRGGKVRK